MAPSTPGERGHLAPARDSLSGLRAEAMPDHALTAAGIAAAARELGERDQRLRDVMVRLGPPPPRERPGGFPSLVLFVLEQQVSLASARTTCQRLSAAAGGITPARVCDLSQEEFRAAGVTRQKTGCIRELARSILDGSLDPDALAGCDDDEVRRRLTRIRGIGPWTADVYLLTCLMRPDVWPAGDLALQIAAASLLDLPERPGAVELASIGEQWRPWRSVAARILWLHYAGTAAGVRARSGGRSGPAGRPRPRSD